MTKIVACISRRWEPDFLVEDWLENMSWVDERIVFDDRDSTKQWHDEAERYRWFHHVAGEVEADYVIVSAPDERFELRAEQVIRRAIEKGSYTGFWFNVLELYTPDSFRCDGTWSRLKQQRMYRWHESQTFSEGALHHSVCPDLDPTLSKQLAVNIYHLKHIEPINRWRRVEVFNKLDSNWEYSPQGYEYLADDSTLKLQQIERGREYKPIYREPYIFNPTLPQEH